MHKIKVQIEKSVYEAVEKTLGDKVQYVDIIPDVNNESVCYRAIWLNSDPGIIIHTFRELTEAFKKENQDETNRR